ncbi:hypothetical protein BTR14_15645 [Rhizobium rhizosphaerae]|uniref:Capsule polysaccharide biosynthesis protein n=1 Tax=Xaviernesmea rhizosphaerae TaxID=1672749 RepID=A0ABX3PA51_9HYPH|nr:hypothetical protein [Xaviernesmea rhizosphaerae]OQP85338.1 hypothetical protein BTR14_15645 [Xaviernesmea rhizosphaerae]
MDRAAAGHERDLPEEGDGARTPARLTLGVHIQAWKQAIVRRYFPERRFVFLPFHLSEAQLRRDWLTPALAAQKPDILVWSLNLPPALDAFARAEGLSVLVMEDGFIRSARPNASRTPPLSLALDSRTAYFDARQASDLEVLLETHDFDADPALMARAVTGMRAMVERGLSKYNGAAASAPGALYGPKSRPRILVIGQVDGDASIRFGCTDMRRQDDLVRLAVAEHPDAEVIFRPHPDVVAGVRPTAVDWKALARICRISTAPAPIAEALSTIDRVYTLTSLAGFEALMRGIPVTVAGYPFYAGWGLTDDRASLRRRQRHLSIEALFAGAYLLYPRYFHPLTGAAIDFEQALRWLVQPERDETPSGAASPFEGAPALGAWTKLRARLLSPLIARVGTAEDAAYFRAFPKNFFQERPEVFLRRLGRCLFP